MKLDIAIDIAVLCVTGQGGREPALISIVMSFIIMNYQLYASILTLLCWVWQGKEAVKDAVYREALQQTPNGFYRRQLYVLEVNLRRQQAMWVELHHNIFYQVSETSNTPALYTELQLQLTFLQLLLAFLQSL